MKNEDNSQPQNSNQSNNHNKKFQRRLDYMADCVNGASFTMVPDKLMEAYLLGRMPEPKFKLICLMIHHGKNFQIWRTTLEKTVSKKSLKIYLPQLIDEGYVEIEAIPTGRGGAVKNVYHVRSLEHWEVYKECASPNGALVNGSPVNGALVNGSPVLDITKPTSNQTKDNQTNDNISGTPDKDRPSKASPAIKPTRRNIVGYLKNAYRFLSKEGAELFTDQLLAINKDHFAVMKALQEKIGNMCFDNLTGQHRAILSACVGGAG